MSEQNHLRTEENPRIDKARILKDRLEKKYSERYAEGGQSGREKTRSRAESQLSTPAERKVRRFTYSPNPPVSAVDDCFLWRVAGVEHARPRRAAV